MKVKIAELLSAFIVLILVFSINVTADREISIPCKVVEKNQCSAENIILGLSNTTNAHIQAYNQTAYPYVLCCEGGNTNCTGNNAIIKISSWTNAHIEISTQENYQISVCYKDLVCTSRENNCNNRETALFSLSSETNAHISIEDLESYPIKICCKSTFMPITGNAIWRNMLNVPINKTNTGDSVELFVNFKNLPQEISGTINYTIYRKAELSWNPFKWFIRRVEQISSDETAVWKTKGTGEFYFKAKVQTGEEINSKDSGIFGILQVTSPEDNSIPYGKIVKPVERSKHLSNVDISFEQNSSDVDDDLNIIWDFGDSQTMSLSNCLSTENCNTTHKYTLNGTKTIALSVIEIIREQQVKDYKTIFIYGQGINLFPVITKPAINQEINGYRTVKFNGEESWVANCTTFGSCHAPSDIECYDVSDEYGNPVLTCYDYPKTDEWLKGSGKKYLLCFNWTIQNKATGDILFERFGEWETEYDSAVKFEQELPAGQYTANLKIGYEKDISKTCGNSIN